MEKITTIFIAGTTFSLTESAHVKLAEYLSELKTHFSREASQDEILRDIESRIAEKLIEKGSQIIVYTDIEAIISEIGQPTQIDDEDTDIKEPVDTKGSKRLYRNMDDAWLGGVASGIAIYFDINPLWVRLGFAVTSLFWGSSIILYLILWILVPEAKTAGQRLEMRGINTTLENISNVVKERTKEVKERGLIKKFFDSIINVVQVLFRFCGKIIGFTLTILSTLTIIGLTIFFGAIVTNWNTSINNFLLKDTVPDGLLLFGVVIVYISIFIPILLLATSGIRLIRKKATVPTSVVLTLVGVWIIVLITGGIVGTNIARHYTETLATDPQYQMETRNLNISAFKKISITDNSRITIKNGETASVNVRSRAVDQEKLNISVENGILIIEESDSRNNCFFCNNFEAEIIVTSPDLDTVSINDGHVQFNEYSDDEMLLELSDSSVSGSLSVPTLEIKADHGYIRTSLETETLSINATHTYFSMDGNAQNATLYLVDSNFGGELFIINSAKLDTKDSTITAKIQQQIDENNEAVPFELEDEID
jgi:phage shock protein PspC (stress-responsive transcriptional regulator)